LHMLLELSTPSSSHARAFESATITPLMPALCSLCKAAGKTSLRVTQAAAHHSSTSPVFPCHSAAVAASWVIAAARQPSPPTSSCQLARFSSWRVASARRPRSPKHGLGGSKLWAVFSFMVSSCIFQILSSIYSTNKGALSLKSCVIHSAHERKRAVTSLAS